MNKLQLFFTDPRMRHYQLLRAFWLFITTVAISYFLCRFDVATLTDLRGLLQSADFSTSLLIVAGALFFVGLLVFIFKPGELLKKQGLRNQPSWIFYVYWGFINSFIVWSTVSFLNQVRESWWSGTWWFGLTVSLAIILLKWINECLHEKTDLTFRDFAAGAAGTDQDDLDFLIPAQHAAEGLKGLKNYVNVAAVYGGLGFGKSSYARMIVEHFDPERTLYTYISLTETNKAKDFSQLFAERWLQTLASRYPKFDVFSYLPFMYSILRESGNGFFSDILEMLSKLDRGLVKTKVAIHDAFYPKSKKEASPVFSSDIVGRIFANIPVISESMWVIMVDEIERAQIDEVYRLVEIVERFRTEGRSGLPVKLLFIFCISEPDFGEYLRMFQTKDTRVMPLQTFFYGDPRSISNRLFLPPVEPMKKYEFIDKRVQEVVKQEQIEDFPKDAIYPNTFSNPTFKFMDHKDALGYLYGVFGLQSLRVVIRSITALDFFYGSFRDRSGGLQKNAIRLSDVLALEFIKIRYPFLIDFFLKTIHYLVAQTEQNNMGGYFLKKELEEKKIGLVGWIEKETGRTLTDNEKQDAQNLIGLVMHYYFDFVGRDVNVKTKDKYAGTTSYPEVMNDYLALVSDSVETSYRKNSQIFQRRKMTDDPRTVLDLNEVDLISYARYLFDLQEAPLSAHVEIIKEMSERLIQGKIKISPMRVEDTPFDEALYQFVFQFVSLTEKERDRSEPSSEINAAFKALKEVLTATSLPVGAKLLILNSLANNTRGGMSSIHSRLEFAFQRLSKYFSAELKELVKSVFKEFDDHYLEGHDVLYDKEENFFFTMYQSWSGSKNDKDQIAKIRAAAKRGLKSHPEALRLYWNQYPLKDEWQDLDDVYRDDVFFPRTESTGTLYMPLVDLIEITKEADTDDKELKAKAVFWQGQQKFTRLQDQLVLKDDPSTLRAVLTRRGLLD